MRWLAVASLLAGCDQVLRLDDIKPPPDAPPCSMPDLHDDFSVPSPVCGTWGKIYGVASWITRGANTLVITPVDGVYDEGLCTTTSAIPFGPYGVFVETSEVETNDGYGVFEIDTYTALGDSAPSASTLFSVATNFVAFADETTCGATGCSYIQTAVYVASQMKWWRMIPDNNGTTIVAQFSADGYTWSEFSRRDLAAPALANYAVVSIGGGNGRGSGGSPGRLVFDKFDVCP